MSQQERDALYGAIRKAMSTLVPEGYEVNFHIIKEHSLLTPEQKRAKNIQLLACKFFDKQPEDILQKTRVFKIVCIRKMICKLLRTYTKLPLHEIARFAGYGYDHTNVIHAIRTLNDLMYTDDKFKKEYGQLELSVFATLQTIDENLPTNN